MKYYTKITSIIVLTMLFLCLGLFGTGCTNAEQTPEDTVNKVVKAWNDLNVDEISNGFENPANIKEKIGTDVNLKKMLHEEIGLSEETAIAIEEKLKASQVEILETKIDGDKAVIKAKVKSLDILKLITIAMDEAMRNMDLSQPVQSDKELAKLFDQPIQNLIKDSKKTPILERDVKINVVKVKNEWKISSNNDEFIGALTGGLTEVQS